MAFSTQRASPLTSLEQDLCRVTTIGHPDALTGSKQGNTTVDRVALVMTYHPFNTYIKQYLLQNFHILSTDQQTQDIFPQPSIVPYKHDLSLRDILVNSTDSSSTEQPGSHAYQCPRCQNCEFITPLIISPICTSAKLGEVSGVELVSICKEYATTPLGFLWHNISTPPVTVLQMFRYEVCVCVEVPTSSANNWK